MKERGWRFNLHILQWKWSQLWNLKLIVFLLFSPSRFFNTNFQQARPGLGAPCRTIFRRSKERWHRLSAQHPSEQRWNGQKHFCKTFQYQSFTLHHPETGAVNQFVNLHHFYFSLFCFRVAERSVKSQQRRSSPIIFTFACVIFVTMSATMPKFTFISMTLPSSAKSPNAFWWESTRATSLHTWTCQTITAPSSAISVRKIATWSLRRSEGIPIKKS